jgi:hypothetical protein
MVLRNYIKITSGAVIFLLIAFLFSCENLKIINCSECTVKEPDEIYLEIKIDPVILGTEITLYEGNLEDSVIYYRFLVYSKVAYYRVPLNRSFTVTAKYTIDGNTFVAVNAVLPRVVYETQQCTDPCYYVYDKTINLRLKNLK